ncbi:flagellar protein FlgN [Brevibacillus sp. SYSU BS000544]|uniref:flagellar protein FlgN n=1 Tax=Brevibacillus sp. SYSU BS000544 TaxID=3416443 RepID=UPI003CE52F60
MAQIDSLYDVLDNLLNLNRALYTLAVQKKDVLIKGDMDALVQMTQQEQKLIKAITTTEASRIQVINEIFAEKGLPLAEHTLLGLTKALTNVDQKSRLTKYREELIRIVSELREANELNQQLLEQSLSFVNHSLDLFTDTPEDDFIYRKPIGNQAMYQPNRSFINKKA